MVIGRTDGAGPAGQDRYAELAAYTPAFGLYSYKWLW